MKKKLLCGEKIHNSTDKKFKMSLYLHTKLFFSPNSVEKYRRLILHLTFQKRYFDSKSLIVDFFFTRFNNEKQLSSTKFHCIENNYYVLFLN